MSITDDNWLLSVVEAREIRRYYSRHPEPYPRHAELVSASPKKPNATLKQVQGDENKAENITTLSSYRIATLAHYHIKTH